LNIPSNVMLERMESNVHRKKDVSKQKGGGGRRKGMWGDGRREGRRDKESFTFAAY